MYLDELSALKAVKVYGLGKVAEEVSKQGKLGNVVHTYCSEGVKAPRCGGYLQNAISAKKYTLPTPESRVHANFSRRRKELSREINGLLTLQENFDLSQAVYEYLYGLDDLDSHRKRAEIRYNSNMR